MTQVPLAAIVMIVAHQVRMEFPNGTLAVDGASLRIDAGEFVSLLGPSGCGKSTLLRMIAGLIPPTAGTLEAPWLGGRRDAARLGFVFQEPTLLPWATAWSNVHLPLRLADRSRTEAAPAVDEALAMVGLAEFADAYPANSRGG